MITAGWEELVAGAVLGTERRPFQGISGADLAATLPGLDPEDLPGAVAAVWACREAGLVPGRAPEPPLPPAGPDDRAWLPDGAVRSLAAILAEPGLRPLLGEWLHLAGQDGRRIPPEWLPSLLDLTPSAHRPDLDRAGGPRVAWLAAQRPDWSSGRAGPVAAALAAAEQAGKAPEWEGPDDDRAAAFALVRAVDPAAARRLAERVWPGEPPAGRAAMVAGLADGLSAADEPFLEAALDDRRKEVRLAASALLARLPSSRFAARMAGRILPLVRMPAGGRLQVGAPPEPDEAARRDGLPARTARPEQWIVQVAGATPLGSWPDPEELVAAAIDAGSEGLVAGWSLAAERQGDRVWARRLLGAGAPPTAGLVRLLGHPDGTAFLLAWLHRVHLGSAVDVLVGLPAPWPAPVTEAVMAALTRLVVTGDQSAPATAVRDALPRLARGADPECLDAVAGPAAALESLPDQKRPGARLFWGRGLASLNAVVHFRHAMHQEFQT